MLLVKLHMNKFWHCSSNGGTSSETWEEDVCGAVRVLWEISMFAGCVYVLFLSVEIQEEIMSLYLLDPDQGGTGLEKPQ